MSLILADPQIPLSVVMPSAFVDIRSTGPSHQQELA